MKILVTGIRGQLGHDVCERLDALAIENRGVDIADFNLTDQAQTMNAITAYQPTCVVHCAAYTNVNQAESDREACFAVNEQGTRNVALACKAVGAAMLYVSTDYVFSGLGDAPFETDAPKAPQNAYGLSKAKGEAAVEELLQKYFIVRTSWVFGHNGNNFVKTMLRLGAEKEQLPVVCDQIGSPTYTRDLAVLICQMVQTEKYGVYHATNEGYCSWLEFAQAIMRLGKRPCTIVPVTTSAYPSAAKRPLNSRLSKASLDKAGFERLPDWQTALEAYIRNEEYGML